MVCHAQKIAAKIINFFEIAKLYLAIVSKIIHFLQNHVVKLRHGPIPYELRLQSCEVLLQICKRFLQNCEALLQVYNWFLQSCEELLRIYKSSL